MPEGKDNKNPDNRYLPYCPKKLTCSSGAFGDVEGRYFFSKFTARTIISDIVMWRTILVIFSLLSTLCQGAERHDTDKITLSDLDNVIRHASEYDRVREDRLDSCRTALTHSKTLEQKYLLYFTMRQTFDRYRTDSATFYAVRSLDAAKELGRQDYISASSLALAKQYLTSGMSYDALTTLNRVDRSALSEKSREELYLFYMSIYESLEGLSIDQSLKQYYSSKASVYKDSIASQFPDNAVAKSERLLLEGDYKSALDVLLKKYGSLSPESPENGPVAIAIADIYLSIGWNDAAKDYMIASAYSDIVNAKKEYVALRMLATMLYEDGDIKRAYSYLNKALDDANFCKARLKVDALAPLISIVNESYIDAKKKDLKILYVCMGMLCFLLLLMTVLLFVNKSQRRKLEVMKDELTESQSLQEEANRIVKESSNIKNTYITQLMLECISRIERLDKYRKNLNKKAIAGDIQTLKRDLKSNAVVEEEWTSFYSVFDKTFLSLFPTFIADFNNFLQPEYRISIKDPYVLTPELRIYALIRLGIDSTDRISILLRYSRSTIYAYRSRTRLKALSPQEFEEQIKGISSI